MTTDKPVLLLDLDGVINALTNPITVPGLPDTIRTVPRTLSNWWPEEMWRYGSWTIEHTKFPLLWSSWVVSQLKSWHDDGDVEIRWHTTWQESALPVAEQLFKLPVFPVQPAPEAHEHEGVLAAALLREGKPGWWKYPAVQRVLDEGRTVIWVDDDITYRVLRRFREKMAKDGRFLAVSPDGAIGLTPRHLRLINIFIADQQEGEGDGRPPAVEVPGP